MDWSKYIKYYYEKGYYTDNPDDYNYLGLFVEVGKITQEQFEEWTGKPYVPPTTDYTATAE
ncbi:XkdX family protein [Bacillus phage 055SW001]|nr:XkdX family protein [Bacillus phage 055SW001]